MRLAALALLALFTQGANAMPTLLHYWPMTEASGHIITDAVNGRLAYVFEDGSTFPAYDAYVPATDLTIVPGPIGSGRDLRGFNVNNVPGSSTFPRHRVVLSDTNVIGYTIDNAFALTQWSLGVKFILNEVFSDRALLTFDAGNSYVEIGINANGSGFTINFWQGPDPSHWSENAFSVGGAYALRNQATQYTVWNSLRLVCDGVDIKVYHNATLIGTISEPLALQPYGNKALVGALGDGNNYVGSVAEIEIWDSVLTQQEITDLWNNGSPISPLDYLSVKEREQLAASWSGEQESYYAVISKAAMDDLRVPISSWQATLQLGRSSYVQAVVPSLLQYVDAIEARTGGTLAIEKRAVLPGGEEQSVKIAEVPFSLTQNYGPTNATGTLSGYSVSAQDGALTWPVTGLQTKTLQSGNRRFRTTMSPFIRPGDTVQIPGDTDLVVSWINFYANTESEYMDFGERAL